ncbi:MAG: penicillin-binding transpeptidase domain-containing protein [Bacillota bacterium]|nr:penicillin-binding transpeptidase domain-containing protein [Bacillota bacterium]
MNKMLRKRNRRLTFVFAVVSLIFFVLIVRLFFIQVFNAEEYQTLASMQRTRDISIPAMRGSIYDRNGTKLAFSIKTFTIWTRPSEVTDINITLDDIDSIIKIDIDDVLEKIEAGKSLVNIKRGLNKEMADAIIKLELKGIWVTDDIQRVYPNKNFASHIIGHTTIDNLGIAGLEQSYNDVMNGIPGKYLVNTDASGRQLAFGTDKKYAPIDGYDIVLTIDQIIQHYLESALEDGYDESDPKGVMGIVMDTKTGEILAMASKPDYNLNVPRDVNDDYYDINLDEKNDNEKVAFWSKVWRNPLVSDLYEPGSVFKLITTSAGLEENVVTPYTKFDAHGYLIIDGVKINCWSHRHPHGEQTLTEGLENSCNPVFMEIQMMLGKEIFYGYVDNFGFNEKIHLGLPAETNSLLIPLENLNNVEAATMSFGQGISITPLQMIRAIGAIANNGLMMQPYIVKEIIDSNGNVIDQFMPEKIRQVISEKTSVEMRLMMESVVENGSGANARIDGIRIGGKTGTSQKNINGQYSDDLFIASFTAIGPVEDPQIAILIIVDEPSYSSFGSVVAAPIARSVLEDTFRYLGVMPKEEERFIEVPDLVGMTYEEASKKSKSLDLTLNVSSDENIEEDSIVVDQYPKAGKKVKEKALLIIKVQRMVESETN